MACVDSITSCVTQGNDWWLDITVTDDGVIDVDTGNPTNPKNLTGATVELQLIESLESVAATISPTATITDAVNGRIQFRLTAAQTNGLIASPSAVASKVYIGSPRVTYQDGTVDNLFNLSLEVHQTRNR